MIKYIVIELDTGKQRFGPADYSACIQYMLDYGDQVLTIIEAKE